LLLLIKELIICALEKVRRLCYNIFVLINDKIIWQVR